RPGPHQTVELVAGLLDKFVFLIEPVSVRARAVARPAIGHRERVLHAERIEHTPLEKVVIGFARHLFYQRAQQVVAGVAVDVFFARTDSLFGEGATKFGAQPDDVGVGRPSDALDQFVVAGVVIKIGDARGVVQQSPNRHLRTVLGKRHKVLSDRIVEMKLARLGEHENPQSGELLTATGKVKYRVWRDRPSVTEIRQPIAGRMNHLSRLDDGKGQSRTGLLDLLGEIIVDLRRALFIEADFLRYR